MIGSLSCRNPGFGLLEPTITLPYPALFVVLNNAEPSPFPYEKYPVCVQTTLSIQDESMKLIQQQGNKLTKNFHTGPILWKSTFRRQIRGSFKADFKRVDAGMREHWPAFTGWSGKADSYRINWLIISKMLPLKIKSILNACLKYSWALETKK